MLFYASFVGLGFWMIMFLTQHQLMQKVLFKEIEAAQVDISGVYKVENNTPPGGINLRFGVGKKSKA